jgi:hypothetical protein
LLDHYHLRSIGKTAATIAKKPPLFLLEKNKAVFLSKLILGSLILVTLNRYISMGKKEHFFLKRWSQTVIYFLLSDK